MVGRVIKKTQVRMAGSRSLEPAGDTPLPCGDAPAQAGARIVETADDGALIEVTCSCGRVTYVRCDYAP